MISPLLRVGIIQGHRIVEERLLRATGAVTIGTSPRSTFIVPSEEIPGRWLLFEERRGQRFLRLGAGMTARIASGTDPIATFPAVSRTEPARPIPLSNGARGKVTIGDATVLFQLVRPPPRQPRPQLPHSVRRRVTAELDRPFAIVLLATFALHVAVVAYLRQVDWPRRPDVGELPDRFVRDIIRRPPPAPPRPAPDSVATTERARPATAPIHDRAAKAPGARPPQLSDEQRRALLEARVQHLGLVPLLMARTTDGQSALSDLLASGAVDRPADEAFRNIGGVRVAGPDALRGLPSAGSGHGSVATVNDLRPMGVIAAPAELGPVAERAAKSRVRVDPPAVEGGRLDPALMAREIRGKRKAIAACYERALKQQPTLAGKLVVRFTIAAAGTVAGVEIDEDTLGSPEVAGCVRALVLHWRFPAPAEAPVEVSFPFLFQTGD